MVVLGLHFGHDASVAVLVDGRIASYVLRERFTRVKHAMTLDVDCVSRALHEAGVKPSDVEWCAVTSTQNVELFIDDPAWLHVSYEIDARHRVPSLRSDTVRANPGLPDLLARSVGRLVHGGDTGSLAETYRKTFPEYERYSPEEIERCGCLDDFGSIPAWQQGLTLDELAAVDARAALQGDATRLGFHAPVVVTLAGTRIPGYFIHHHMAHAGSSYYSSGFPEAAILSHDGFSTGQGYHGGMYYYGRGHRIYPLMPHHLVLGMMYDAVGIRLGLGVTGPAGKLMGLAAWGQPRFFHERFVGNRYDLARRGIDQPAETWWQHCVGVAGRMGYDLALLGKPEHATAPVNADIAASTQRLFEASRMLAVRSLHDMLGRSGVSSDNLCLTGGVALNCPSNTQIYNESPFRHVHVEPYCDDGGLSIGAARVLHHNLLDLPRMTADSPPASAYLGVQYRAADVDAALAACGDRIRVARNVDVGMMAAADLQEDRVVALFCARSEAGPRALGHRSILAHPGQEANWARVNRIKFREPWRPFAPVVLEEEQARWFAGAPSPSPYMLFNARVRSERIPAVTHRDGTARVQSVPPDGSDYRRIIEQFFRATGIPVLLNTSFNGPGEPVVETPGDALRFFLASELDVLYLQGHRVVRAGAGA